MLSRFIAYNIPWKLADKRLLLACSGGLDSTVMAMLCHAADYDFALAHCNFKLRGKESDGDQQFVERLGQQLGRKVYALCFDTEAHAKKTGLSIQMAARELRYDWFRRLASEAHFDAVLTAHHADDGLETFLINLSRGTGIDGLTGIPMENGIIVRPLLHFSRDEIRAYAQQEDLQWREDSSNAQTKYLRNQIRHGAVPKLKELHPRFLQNFQQTQRYLLASRRQLASFKTYLRQQLFMEDGDVVRISLKRLGEFSPNADLMFLLLSDFGFGSWDDVFHLTKATSGKQVVSDTHRLVRDRDSLLLVRLDHIPSTPYPIKKGIAKILKPIAMHLEHVAGLGPTNPRTIYIDADMLDYPLTLRHWQKGDWFCPFGMKGKKKVSNYFKDEKMDIISKSKQWLLCSDDKIVWIVGMRADHRFRVTKTTKRILRIQLH